MMNFRFRKKSRICCLIFVQALFIAIDLSSLSFSWSANNPQTETLRIRVVEEPGEILWPKATTSSDLVVAHSLMDGLVSLTQTGTLTPALAERWEEETKSRTFTFFLRKDILWSDGRALVSDDFIGIGQDRGCVVEIQGKLKFKIQCSKNVSISEFSEPWSFPLRRDKAVKAGAEWGKPGNSLSLGPYILQSIEKGTSWFLRANDHYYRGRPPFSEVQILIERNDPKSLQKMKSGKWDLLFDVMTKPPGEDFGGHFIFSESLIYRLELNEKQFPLHQRQVRCAFLKTLPVDQLISELQKKGFDVESVQPAGSSPHATGADTTAEILETGINPLLVSRVDLLVRDWDIDFHVGQWLEGIIKARLKWSVRQNIVSSSVFQTHLTAGTPSLKLAVQRWDQGKAALNSSECEVLTLFRTSSRIAVHKKYLKSFEKSHAVSFDWQRFNLLLR